ncbi:hypothetical protein [Xanthomonas theicola]|uniref:hypothetical protein n=1 Tax=Xanthomonas theicola TaxID=56464 RepID=UPI000FF8916E|nr:hypothetical protein [Xanthomonas theicola]QNH23983.1 hypothetical protein G4Q83_03325 [Xanthomonas theicola]
MLAAMPLPYADGAVATHPLASLVMAVNDFERRSDAASFWRRQLQMQPSLHCNAELDARAAEVMTAFDWSHSPRRPEQAQ